MSDEPTDIPVGYIPDEEAEVPEVDDDALDDDIPDDLPEEFEPQSEDSADETGEPYHQEEPS